MVLALNGAYIQRQTDQSKFFLNVVDNRVPAVLVFRQYLNTSISVGSNPFYTQGQLAESIIINYGVEYW